MASGRNQIVLRHVRTLFDVGTVGGLTDGELLDRFEAGRGEVAELAFAVLVERHGPMVLRACRKVLRDEHAAQDAFQATFLVLARKAGSIRRRDTLGPWLHGVACRVASCARASAARRRRHEETAASLAPHAALDPRDDEAGAALHEEIARLPERYRRPVVLCCLEGLTREQAALRLGLPVGTVQSRLARGRERLKDRLIRRGLAPAVGTVAASLAAEAASAPVPTSLIETTVVLAKAVAAGHGLAGVVPAGVASLLTGVLKAMFFQKLKAALAASAAVATVGVGIALGQQPFQPGQQQAQQQGRQQGQDVFGGGQRADAAGDDRLDQLERKIDRLIDALDGRADPRVSSDRKVLEGEVALAEAKVRAATDRLVWAEGMKAKGFVSDGQMQSDRIALKEAALALDRARARLAATDLSLPKSDSTTTSTKTAERPPMNLFGARKSATKSAEMPPQDLVGSRAPEQPAPKAEDPFHASPLGLPTTPRTATPDLPESSRLDRIDRRIEALERRIEALEQHAGAFRGPMPPSGRGELRLDSPDGRLTVPDRPAPRAK